MLRAGPAGPDRPVITRNTTRNAPPGAGLPVVGGRALQPCASRRFGLGRFAVPRGVRRAARFAGLTGLGGPAGVGFADLVIESS